MTRFAFATPRAATFVRERPEPHRGAWEESLPWDPDYDEIAGLGPLRDLSAADRGALRAALAVQATLFAAATGALAGQPGGRRWMEARAAARALSRVAGDPSLRAACARVLRWCGRAATGGATDGGAAALCSRLAALARRSPGPMAAAACQRLRFEVASRHGIGRHARAAARRLGRCAADHGDPSAERWWGRWAAS